MKNIYMKKSKIKRVKRRKSVSGVITVEMSYLMPIVLLIFAMTVHTVFYYHDKNILIGAAAETAVVGAQMERKPNETVDLNGFFSERISGKLILFSGASVTIEDSGKWVQVEARAENGKRKLQIVQRAVVIEPEKNIRRKRIAENLIETNNSHER